MCERPTLAASLWERKGAENWWAEALSRKNFKLRSPKNKAGEARAEAHNENPGRKWAIFKSRVARYNVLSPVRAAKIGELTVENSYRCKEKI